MQRPKMYKLKMLMACTGCGVEYTIKVDAKKGAVDGTKCPKCKKLGLPVRGGG